MKDFNKYMHLPPNNIYVNKAMAHFILNIRYRNKKKLQSKASRNS